MGTNNILPNAQGNNYLILNHLKQSARYANLKFLSLKGSAISVIAERNSYTKSKSNLTSGNKITQHDANSTFLQF